MTVERALLDTSVIIDPPGDLAAVCEQAAICTISLAELAFGLHVADPVVAARRADAYSSLVRSFDPIGFSSDAARMFGALCAAVRDSGRSRRPRRFDLLIAAVAAAENLPLVTRNPGDFAHIHEVVRVISVAPEAAEQAGDGVAELDGV